MLLAMETLSWLIPWKACDCYLAGHNIGTTLYHYGIVADYFDYGNTVTYVDQDMEDIMVFV